MEEPARITKQDFRLRKLLQARPRGAGEENDDGRRLRRMKLRRFFGMNGLPGALAIDDVTLAMRNLKTEPRQISVETDDAAKIPRRDQHRRRLDGRERRLQLLPGDAFGRQGVAVPWPVHWIVAERAAFAAPFAKLMIWAKRIK